jgi:hypothetical protein
MRKHLLIAAACVGLLALSRTDSKAQITGPSTSSSPYLVSTVPGGTVTSIITAGESAPNGYKMCGIPDGLGAFDNGNGTFTVLMNHEFGSNAGAVRASGSKGAFVSKWIINKSDLSVVSGSDLTTKVNLWNPATNSYTTYNSAFPSPLAAMGRFCSADLAPVSSLYNSNTGKGTQARIFMNGEESGTEGRGMAHIVTGPEAGNSYELPHLGKFSWENALANPRMSDTTVVVGTDDATPGQVYFYMGIKSATGSEIEKAGLTGGKLYSVAVNGLLTETNTSVPASNTPFTMVDLGQVQNMTGAVLNTNSNNAGVTRFLRPEDGAWDPNNPSDFYFTTTNAFGSRSRLWRLRFTNPANITQGGTITAVLDGTEGQQMLDNMAIDNSGHIILVEDAGNNAHVGKVWEYTIATDLLKAIFTHDSTRFFTGGANLLTLDEEASGQIDVQNILGPGMFLIADQAHYSIPGEVVEGGQLLALYNPATALSNPEINITGNSVNIVSGTNTTATTDNTDFGGVNIGQNVTKTFVIQNIASGGNLNVQSININGANASEFALVTPPAFPLSIPANGTQVITVRFTPTTASASTARININSNDFDEVTYNYAIKGLGTVPLPLGLEEFTATKVTDGVMLRWSIASNNSAGTVQLERSDYDARGFTNIYSLPMSRNSLNNKYDYLDRAVLNRYKQPGHAYYRLKLISEAGEITYSKIQKVHFSDATENVVLWPNPFVSEFNLAVSGYSGKCTWVLSDVFGRRVKEGEIYNAGANSTVLIDGGILVPGTYYLSIDQGTHRSVYVLNKIQ